MKRICIYTKDIQIVTGKSERCCRNILTRIKKIHKKEKHQSVSIAEFCNYQDLNIEEVKRILKL